ncbi:B12-binding domain-containing radical SAM protein [Salipaludibacillus keqinensis]|uniref:B12-binding domain-containing radical SAM protein n=1 Tax=Salipaludibacillus keqinensis TaxID=2045207 RepID=A0A323TGH5_9BACI|nr:B12-binding domain-containing radical SAM protein [Salipaludibacillus keqinensis]PYZ93570.1 B12-binding domain-containing radical SAM protein [Salipaludibacillus keqinensis]
MNIVVTSLNAKYIHTCLALRLLKGYAEPEFKVDMCEFTIKDPEMDIVSDLYMRKPDVIGFSCYIWNIEKTIQVAKMIKKVLPKTVIVFGGPEVSYDTSLWMERIPEVDMIVRGEGEETFKQILQAVENKESYHSIGSLAFRENGQVILTPSKANLDINTIPSPYRFDEDREELNKRIVYFETSRGCPFQCQFCLSSIEVGVRYFDINKVKSDLLYLIESGAKMVKFVDRTFNIKRDYALDIFQFLIDNHQGCQFQFEITADIMRPEVLEFLNENAPPGVFRFEIGVQSTNDDTNVLVKRKQNFSKLSRTVRLIKEGGKIDQHLDLIAGLPEEDYSSFKRTFNDVIALDPEELQLGFLKMLRGTGMRAMADKYDYKYMDHAPYEILSNQILSFDEVVRIKRVEDILEKYWNDHRLDHTIHYLINHQFETPFDFFQQFGDFWDSHGWGKIGHQFEDLFLRLSEFLDSIDVSRRDIIDGLMKIDYLIHFQQKPRKMWWTNRLSKEEVQDIRKKTLDVNDELQPYMKDARTMSKHIIVEPAPFNIDAYLLDGRIDEERGMMFVLYDPKEGKPKVHFTTMESSLLT